MSGPPALMGILNASPDSFSDGRAETLSETVGRGRALIAAGASILDVGGESARGDRPAVSVGGGVAGVGPVGAALAGAVGVSGGTYKAGVGGAVLEAGASIINDVSGLREPALASLCAR